MPSDAVGPGPADVGTGGSPALRRALATIQDLRSRLEAVRGTEPLAVVGVGLRLPGGVTTLTGLRTLLASGGDSLGRLPAQRRERFEEEWAPLPQVGGFLDDVLGFDPSFFGISPREARHMDPQHRLLMEVAWEALDDAAIPADTLGDARVGVFVGITASEYPRWRTGEPDAYWATGNGSCFAAGRLSYTLGLTGPSVAVDTACSSSLVAVHQARQSLLRDECEVALAGGVNLVLAPHSTELIVQTRSLAPDGRCKPFDARANGFTRGEGCAVLVLKKLSRAIDDGDRVHAVLAGSAVNQDGRSTGFTAPNVRSQVSLIRAALADAGIGPERLDAVETHGTGTALGDPIEIAALTEVLGTGAAPVPVGAVKANLGHLEAAAGMAGLLRAVLSVTHREAYPVAGFRTLSPRIELEKSRVTVPAVVTPLAAEGPVHVGVSSFGMSGTNAHVVVGSTPPEAVPSGCPVEVGGFELAANDAGALRQFVGLVVDRLEKLPAGNYPGLAYTLTAGRARQTERLVVNARSPAAAITALRAWLRDPASAPAVTHRTGRTGEPGDAVADGLPRRVVNAPTVPWQRRPYAPPFPGTQAVRELPVGDLVWETVPASPGTCSPLLIAGSDIDTVARLATTAGAAGAGVTVVPAWVRDAGEWTRYWRENPPATGATLVLVPRAHELPERLDAASPSQAAAGLVSDTLTAIRCLPTGTVARVATRGARQVHVEPVAATDAGVLHGLLGALRLDHSDRVGGLLDLPAEPATADLTAALTAVDSIEDLLAVRDGRTFAARLHPRNGPADGPLPVHPDGAYLVTGITGAIGRRAAADLAARGAGAVIGVGRRPLGELSESERSAFQQLGAGAKFTYLTVNAEDGAELAAAVRATVRDGRPVRGVVHTAGVIGSDDLATITRADVARALTGKFAGAWWLHLLAVQDQWPLDFFVGTSSVTGLWGTTGRLGYAAANGGLDTVMRIRSAGQLPSTAIAFGPWAVDGMATATDLASFDRIGLESVQVNAGIEALGALPHTEGLVVGCGADWARLAQVIESTGPRSVLAGLRGAPAAQPQPVASGTTESVEVAATVRAAVAELLGHDDVAEVPADRGFLDLGMDSIMVVDLAAALTARLGRPVTVADVFGHPTVSALSAQLSTGEPVALPPAGALPDRLVRAAVIEPATQPSPAAAPQPGAAGGAAVPVAIIGMAGRFPSAVDVDSFWDLLIGGRDGVSTVPDDRWEGAAARDCLDRMTTDQGGFLPELRAFDAGFFGIPAREAQNLDPAQRMLLQAAWHALEDAAIAPNRLRGTRTGVFVGVSGSDYARLLETAGPAELDAYFPSGTALNAGPGRIAYLLGLTGPAMAVDTACSSSLVALHLAVRSLRSGETDCILTGGVNVITSPVNTVAVSRAHMLSPEGRCKAFSAAADGFVRSEGCAILVLKRLDDALRDGDPVRAVIRGTATNSDGASAGLTAPNPSAQQQVIEAALRDAGLPPAAVGYLESHGTGTELGDPIEISAADAVYGRDRPAERPLLVGSVKSNVGHAESAAGVLAVIKTVLALEHEIIPANLHCAELNPHIDWAGAAVRVVREHEPWARGGEPRLAGVSGFGFSGTNAHVILAEAPEPARRANPDQDGRSTPAVLAVSAPDSDGLRRTVARWQAFLADAGDEPLSGFAATALGGRDHFPHRRALVAATAAEAATLLSRAAPAGAPGTAPRVGLLFTGQGSQYPGMGRELYEAYPVFADSIARSDSVLRGPLGGSLVDLVLAAEDVDRLNQTWLTQPALVALELAMTDLWTSWGLVPVGAIGHSVGEVAAAIVSGVLARDDGLAFIAERARLMQDTAPGAMAGVPLALDDVRAAIEGRPLDVAAVNGPRAVVVAGAPDDVDALVTDLGARGVRARRLAVTRAFHSRLMDPILQPLRDCLAGTAFGVPSFPLIANLTGEPATAATYDARYWVDHVRHPVHFAQGAAALAGLPVDVALEVGPDRTLSSLIVAGDLLPADRALPSMQRGRDPRATVLDAARALYEAGAELDWSRVQGGPRRNRTPGYVFARTEHWPPLREPSTAPGAVGTPHWGRRLHSPGLLGTVFQTERSVSFPPYLTDHRLYGTVVTPAASHLATLLSALDPGGQGVLVEDMVCPRALTLQEDERFELQFVLGDGVPSAARRLQVASLLDERSGRWQEHLSGTVTVGAGQYPVPAAVPDRADFRATADRVLTGKEFYDYFRGLGYDLGPSFRWIDAAWVRGREALVRFRQPQLRDDPRDYRLYPGLIDSCFQSIAVFMVDGNVDVAPSLAVPFAAEALGFPAAPAPGEPMWGHVRVTEAVDLPGSRLQVSEADLHMTTESGASVMVGSRFRVRHAPREMLRSSLLEGSGNVHELAWVPVDPATPRLLDEAGRPLRIHLRRDPGDLAAALAGAGHELVASATGADAIIDGAALRLGPSAGATADLARAVAQDLIGSPASCPVVLPAPAGPDEAPLREALFGMLSAIEKEQPDRTLVRLTMAPVGVRSLAAEVALRLPYLPDRTRLRWDGDWSAQVLRGADVNAGTTPWAGPGAALITGGLGALGLSVARMLVGAGCRSVTLLGRSTPDIAAEAVMAELRGQGVDVRAIQAAVEDDDRLRAVLTEAGRAGPLETVWHLAGTTADRSVELLTPADWDRVFRGKASGADVLLRLLADTPAVRIVLFSSVSAALGSVGQANYAAANGYLDGLAVRARANGRTVTSIAWGPWTGGIRGGLAASDAVARVSAALGIRPLGDADAAEVLSGASLPDTAHVLVAAIDPAGYAAGAGRRGRELMDRGGAPTSTDASPPAAEGWLRVHLAALEPILRPDALRAALREEVARTIGDPGLAAGGPGVDTAGFSDLGMDSIMVIDLRRWLSTALDASLPAMVALDHSTVDRLSRFLLDTVFDPPADPPLHPAPAPRPAVEALRADGHRLSLEELIEAAERDLAMEV